MMTKKTMTILSVFMIVALTAVGFAAWLIVGTIEADTTGSFVSNELKDKYFKVEVEFDTTTDKENGQIIYGRPSTAYDSERNAWLSYSNKDKVEHLTSTATVKFIPDDGFFKNDTKPEENRDMKYYLEEVIENEDATSNTTQYRTVRVLIDIETLVGSDEYKWFDMAVELGYIQYPTAFVIEKNADGEPLLKGDANDEKQTFENVDAEYKLKWVTDTSTIEERDLVTLTDNEYTKFKNGCLAIDLDYSKFFVDYDENGEAKEATAEIQIDFAWGEKMSLMEGGETVFANPYKYFGSVTPESAVTIEKYFDESSETLKDVNAIDYDDAKTTDVVEGYENDDAKTIRNKDLAQRMLDYLRDYLNYTAPVYEDDGTTIKTPAKGIQFSITLIEGTPVVE